ncbi:MAG: hypothetical protein J2P25_16190 [Nocardiopsaceae bacterium]|nr:hypothetical protein [Nocardiopsaceae bacterium]
MGSPSGGFMVCIEDFAHAAPYVSTAGQEIGDTLRQAVGQLRGMRGRGPGIPFWGNNANDPFCAAYERAQNATLMAATAAAGELQEIGDALRATAATYGVTEQANVGLVQSTINKTLSMGNMPGNRATPPAPRFPDPGQPVYPDPSPGPSPSSPPLTGPAARQPGATPGPTASPSPARNPDPYASPGPAPSPTPGYPPPRNAPGSPWGIWGDLAEATGLDVELPTADPQALRAVGDQWNRLGEVVGEWGSVADSWMNSVIDSNSGPVIDAIAGRWRPLSPRQHGDLDALAHACTVLWEQCYAHADAIDDFIGKLKNELVDLFTQLVLTVVIGVAFATITAGASAELAGEAAAAEVASWVTRLAGFFVDLSETAASTLAENIVFRALLSGLVGATFGAYRSAGTDVALDGIYIMVGHQRIPASQVAKDIESGAISGAVGGASGTVASQVGNSLVQAADEQAKEGNVAAAAQLVQMASLVKGGAMKAATSLSTSTVYQLATSGNVSGTGLASTGLSAILTNLLRNEGARAK